MITEKSLKRLEDLETLTKTEMEVLVLLCEGLENKLIADRMDISFHTAKFHVNNVVKKLKATTRTEAAVRAVRVGLVP